MSPFDNIGLPDFTGFGFDCAIDPGVFVFYIGFFSVRGSHLLHLERVRALLFAHPHVGTYICLYRLIPLRDCRSLPTAASPSSHT